MFDYLHMILGLCLEHCPPPLTSKYKQAEHDSAVLRCFERSGDLALLHLQVQEVIAQKTLSEQIAHSCSKLQLINLVFFSKPKVNFPTFYRGSLCIIYAKFRGNNKLCQLNQSILNCIEY